LASEFNDSTLFDLTPTSEEVAQADLRHSIIQAISEATTPPTRLEIQLKLFTMGYFARLKLGEINAAIVELLERKKIERIPIKGRINDETAFRLSDAATQQSLF